MLFYETIHSRTHQLLKQLQSFDFLQGYRLVGGTALALQVGHRRSIDLDFFSNSEADISFILNKVRSLGKVKIVNQNPSILNLFIDDIKVDFVSYPFEWLNDPINEDELKLASILDIAAMKLAAITGGGARKYFIDLYFLLEKYSLPELLEVYMRKYPEGSEFLVYKSLVYFTDAELEPMPKMLIRVNWDELKSKVISEVKKYFP